MSEQARRVSELAGFWLRAILSWVVVLMNCLLQHPTTGLFLAPDFSWTEEEGEACTFGSAACALRFCATYAVSPVQIVVGFSTRR